MPELLRSLVGLGVALGLRVSALGVETSAQLAFLREIGCPTVQGPLFAPALPGADIQGLIGRDLLRHRQPGGPVTDLR